MHNIFTNNKDFGGNFQKEFDTKLKESEHLIIASGYIGATILKEFENKLVYLSKRGRCKILVGMIYHGGVTAKQKEALISLDKKLRAVSADNGIYISREQYHGKYMNLKRW